MSRLKREEFILPFLFFFVFSGGLLATTLGWFVYYDHKRWLSLFFYSVISLLVVLPPFRFKINVSHVQGTLVSALFLYLMIHSIMAGGGGAILEYLNLLAMFLALQVGTLICRNYPENIKLILDAIPIIFFIYYLTIILGYIFVLITPFEWSISLLAVGFDNVRFLNQIQVIIFPLFLFFSMEKKYYLKYISSFLVVFTLSFLLYSSARGAILSVFLECCLFVLVYYYFFRVRLRLFIFKLSYFGFLALLIYLIFFHLIPNLIFQDEGVKSIVRVTSSGRLEMWSDALSGWLVNPIFGNGSYSYAGYFTVTSKVFGHPHNSIIQVLFEQGLVGLLLVVGIVLNFFKAVVSNFKQNMKQDTEVIVLVISILGTFAYSLLSGVFVTPFSQLLVMIFTMFLWSKIHFNQARSSVFIGNAIVLSEAFSIAVTIIIIAFLWVFSFFSWSAIMGTSVLVFDVGPRFWLIGRFL